MGKITSYSCDFCGKGFRVNHPDSISFIPSKDIRGANHKYAIQFGVIRRGYSARRDFCNLDCLIEWIKREMKPDHGETLVTE